MTRAGRSLAALVLALAATQACAISKCTDAKGKVTYLEGPCPAATREQKVTVMPGPAAAPQGASRAAPSAPAAAANDHLRLLSPKEDVDDPRMNAAARMLATYEGCEAAAPDFGKDGGSAAYQQWRADNADLLARLPRSQHSMKVLAVERQHVQLQLGRPESRGPFLDSCQALAKPKR